MRRFSRIDEDADNPESISNSTYWNMLSSNPTTTLKQIEKNPKWHWN